MTGMTQPHVDPPTITLIKENNYGKSDKYVVKIKLRGYPTSPTLDLYEFKFSLLDKGKLEELVLLVCNFKMTLAELGTLEAGAKYKYLRTLFRGESLRQLDSLSSDVEGTETLNVDYIIRCLAQ